MAISEQHASTTAYHQIDDTDEEEEEEDEESYSDSDSDYDPGDSGDDDRDDAVREDAHSTFSELSIKNTAKSRVGKNVDRNDDDADQPQLEARFMEIGEKEDESSHTVLSLVHAGQLEKLKVEQCKAYLRKNGLRLTGNKETLIQRIKEHIEIVTGRGEEKYPVSSFVLKCKGDACTGDVVMFQQNVYDLFNIASRSASGPPCGKRIVAGRIVKESYGAAKQQHTFTIEVLWSKGEKPLPPLHPLLIKGRNLYRYNTMRQRWEDEGERAKALMEKHSRGSLARSDREARLQEKERRKLLKESRTSKKHNIKKNRVLPLSISTSKAGNEAGQLRGSSIAAIGQPTVRPIQMSSTENRRSRDQFQEKRGDSQNSLSSMNRTKHEFWHSRNDANLGNQRPNRNFSNVNGAMQVQRRGSNGESSFCVGPNSAHEGLTAFRLPHWVHERQPLASVNQHPRNSKGGASKASGSHNVAAILSKEDAILGTTASFCMSMENMGKCYRGKEKYYFLVSKPTWKM
ncbi:LOW QUALITY PROTEIN: zinc finger CCCH domain-containing protein 62 [Syzygium oleosum]|uniref:LOW QUALITY PROTEIN: zinc finger CCCH domain-containing protein 62 n=1 Tax=Syzygium oleosum TaxID=219896 RepID=UPI0024B9CD4D|nr:LOW QUALITY PROTEIN: zinc finger CCCH domain-containing protein 62 [Syzygium oleosum]